MAFCAACAGGRAKVFGLAFRSMLLTIPWRSEHQSCALQAVGTDSRHGHPPWAAQQRSVQSIHVPAPPARRAGQSRFQRPTHAPPLRLPPPHRLCHSSPEARVLPDQNGLASLVSSFRYRLGCVRPCCHAGTSQVLDRIQIPRLRFIAAGPSSSATCSSAGSHPITAAYLPCCIHWSSDHRGWQKLLLMNVQKGKETIHSWEVSCGRDPASQRADGLWRMQPDWNLNYGLRDKSDEMKTPKKTPRESRRTRTVNRKS